MTRTPPKNRLLYVILAIFIQVSFLPAQAEALCLVKRSVGLDCCLQHARTVSTGHAHKKSCCASRTARHSEDGMRKSEGSGGRRAPCTCPHRLPDAFVLPDGHFVHPGSQLLLSPPETLWSWTVVFEAMPPIREVVTRARTGPPLILLHQVYLI